MELDNEKTIELLDKAWKEVRDVELSERASQNAYRLGLVKAVSTMLGMDEADIHDLFNKRYESYQKANMLLVEVVRVLRKNSSESHSFTNEFRERMLQILFEWDMENRTSW